MSAQTLTIELKAPNALQLLESLEVLKVIHIVKENEEKESGEKLSERIVGSITSEQAEEMHRELKKMRNEWERDF